ncbi:EAL domain-containing protein [Idiomarina sp.]|uniref:sensor domain-containing phosphodiesterase n=1 Tax=Idiomarina sp. TaxID=1874361 RepID=UPI001D718471|nr:EAL domain-containing protein [Idiomarina sp.]MCH2454396.1 diguanylate cyclase [Idiomarina sp.]MCJ8317589.1 diguanylate cyclase [Idiomarina sp.]NQZ17151.1 diguanylate cyclase [Idiomarina sp.]
MTKGKVSNAQIQQLQTENERLQKVVDRLKGLTQKYRSAEVVQKALFRISELAASAREMDNFYRSLHEIIGELMYARNFYISLYDAKDETVDFVYFVDEVDQDTLFEQVPIDQLSKGLTGYVLRKGQSLRCPPEVYQRLIEQGEIEGLGAEHKDWLGVPLKHGEATIGIMVVQSYNEDVRYDSADEDLLMFVSQHVVNALERLKQRDLMQSEIEHQTAELRHVNESLMSEITIRERAEQQTSVLFAISELTNTSDDMGAFYRQLHRQIGKLIHADNFYVALLSDDKKFIHFPYHVDETGNKAEKRRVGKGLTEYVIKKREPAFIDSGKRQQLLKTNEIELGFGGMKLAKQWLGSPLMMNGQVFGVIAVQTYDGEFLYQSDDLELLNFVSQHVAVAIDRKRSAEEIQRVNQFLEKKVAERTEELVSEIERRKKTESNLFHAAHHDNLTGLPNRILFNERLKQAVTHKRRHPEHHFAVLFVDLDRFKNINDTLGHSAGDEFLLEVSKRIGSCVRDNDMVARLGGDEFVILLDTITSIEDAKDVAKRIIQQMNEPFQLNGQEHYSGASIGIAECLEKTDSAERLLRDADAAMYQAKGMGRGRYVLFDDSMHESLVDSVRKETALRHAKVEKDFAVNYQPIMQLDTGEVRGIEARIEWQDPRYSFDSIELLPLAERTGLIVKLDRYALKTACQWVANKGLPQDVLLHVNLSVRHLLKTSHLNELVNIVLDNGVKPEQVALEFDETSLVQDGRRVLASLRRLSEFGFTLAIDNFGSGSGPLQFLYNFPFSILKLDHHYIARLGSNSRAQAMLKHIVTLCHELDIQVYADGLETEGQKQDVEEQGVVIGQGSYIDANYEVELKKDDGSNFVCA